MSHTVAVQLWTLGRMLPVMIGHYVPENDEYWIHYIELLDIVDLIFSPTVHPNMPGYLEVAIEENLEMFVTLYGGASIILKMQFLIHVPRLLERQVIPYTAKHLRVKTFSVGLENECSWENFFGSSFFNENFYC